MSTAERQAFQHAETDSGRQGAEDSPSPGASQSALDTRNRQTGTGDSMKGAASEEGIRENDTVASLNTARQGSQQGTIETKAPRDVKLPPRDQLEQELVDYEVEEADVMPVERPPPVKPAAQTGDKPQPPKISWNAWAGADGAENTRRAAEMKEAEKRDMPLPDAQRPSLSEGRRNRDEGRDGRGYSGRYGHSDSQRYSKDQRRFGRDRSPVRRNYRNSHSRTDEGATRRGNVPPSHPGMPPGMSYGRTSSGPRFMQSGPMESLNPSTRPMPTTRAMPPGLGVPGAAPRELPHPPNYPAPMENRRTMPMRDNRMRRSPSPPAMRNDRPARQPSPMRHDRNRRPYSPHHSDTLGPPVPRARSPHRAPMPYGERTAVQRQAPRGGRPQAMQNEMAPDSHRRERMDGSPVKPRDVAPASPRRFIPPEKRPPYHRQQPAGNMEHEYPRGPPGNPGRHPASGRWSPPPREYQRRPVSPSMPRSGVPRRSPPPMHGPMRRYPRDASPPMRQRRDMDAPFRRREEHNRPSYMMTDRGHRQFGPSAERPAAGRYGDHVRDPPSSPGRNIKRQRPSPSDEQRFRREPAHHRSAMDPPHENPADSDRMSGHALHYPETECAWFYVDPHGNTQGPCTIEQFRVWLRTLAHDPQFADEHKQFMSVDVWKEGVQKQLMTDLLEHNVP